LNKGIIGNSGIGAFKWRDLTDLQRILLLLIITKDHHR